MNSNGLIRYRKQIETLYEKRLKALRSEMSKKLAAIDVLLEGEHEPEPKTPPAVPQEEPSGDVSHQNGAAIQGQNGEEQSLPDILWQAVVGKTSQFSSRTLAEEIAKKHAHLSSISPHDLSNPLWRLAREGKITLVRKGAGRSPSVYVRTF